MKKKIGLSIVAVSIIAGAFVFAESGTKKADNVCPDRPGCICTKQTTEEVAKPVATASVDKKDICPNTPGCICK